MVNISKFSVNISMILDIMSKVLVLAFEGGGVSGGMDRMELVFWSFDRAKNSSKHYFFLNPVELMSILIFWAFEGDGGGEDGITLLIFWYCSK